PKLNRQYCWQDYLLKGQQPLLKKWRHVIIQKICFARLERISPSNDTVVLKYPTRKILKLDTLIFPVIYHLQHISRSEEHTSELQSRFDLVCRLLLEKKKKKKKKQQYNSINTKIKTKRQNKKKHIQH